MRAADRVIVILRDDGVIVISEGLVLRPEDPVVEVGYALIFVSPPPPVPISC